jgi:two-component system response regulator HydG
MNKAKILIVDDEKEVLEYFSHYFNRLLECKIDLAATGEEALERIKAENFDLIFLDIKMPGLSGIDVLRRLKSDNILPDVIIMTGYNSGQVAKEVLEVGAIGYLIKPIPPEKLHEKAKEVLTKKNKYQLKLRYGAGAE